MQKSGGGLKGWKALDFGGLEPSSLIEVYAYEHLQQKRPGHNMISAPSS